MNASGQSVDDVGDASSARTEQYRLDYLQLTLTGTHPKQGQ